MLAVLNGSAAAEVRKLAVVVGADSFSLTTPIAPAEAWRLLEPEASSPDCDWPGFH